MQKITRPALLIALFTIAFSCNNGNDALTKKKADLEKLKTDKADVDKKISDLEKDIAKIDTSAGAKEEPKLIAMAPVAMQEFKHYLQLQGSVDDKNVSYITPAGQAGLLKELYVKQGDHVKKGQLVARLDNAVALQSVVAAKQQLGGVKTQLDLAKSVYGRQKNLWDQHIGTEVQLLTDKASVEGLENQLKALEANVNTAQTTANLGNVYSNVDGVVDEVTTHVGETFSGMAPAGYIKVVNEANVKITMTVPENYTDKVSKGTLVEVEIPDANKTFSGSISFLSQTVGTNSRGLTAEVKVPAGIPLRPNQIAMVKILDYSVPKTIVINVNTLQNDEQGKFVLVASKEGDKLFARKRKVVIGELYGDQIEIKQGLKEGEQLITEGYQSIFDGQLITTKPV